MKDHEEGNLFSLIVSRDSFSEMSHLNIYSKLRESQSIEKLPGFNIFVPMKSFAYYVSIIVDN
jgi:hypothetical protein